ncbi:phosphotransferase family protein [Phenylobacterium sp. J367]|uniref:phosphotransferase family protein n=1 Tax=Phenylobacterium sp. J367 TaxID=2898435 RepID=UPI0021519442|nr:aminoglycoside phosphotransferase family protein [Phenylobacterium sp. J367]MCR5881144.1 aminoglycoside phosphotransferase family protein [Phenylobacterium sp. J367]
MPHDAVIMQTLRAGGLLPPDADAVLEPLTGGVSSEVYWLETPNGPVCVKRALGKLRVAADWRAPVERSHFEVAWLRTARPLVGKGVPEVLLEDRDASLFVMTFFDPATHAVWKSELAAGRIDVAFAGRLGAMLGRIHAGCAGSSEIAEQFPTTALFEDLRLDPYLRETARRHPDLAGRLTALADRTAASRISLVHGDVSPKNILQGPEGPVLLDAECAWYGDPAFDVAFCSTHLLLKPVWKPAHTAAYLESLATFHAAYRPAVGWEPQAALETRAAELTAALLLARVDGKSPVEYLQDEADRAFVRGAARRLIAETPASLGELAQAWARALEER